MSHNRGFRANIIVWGMPKDLPTLDRDAFEKESMLD